MAREGLAKGRAGENGTGRVEVGGNIWAEEDNCRG